MHVLSSRKAIGELREVVTAIGLTTDRREIARLRAEGRDLTQQLVSTLRPRVRMDVHHYQEGVNE